METIQQLATEFLVWGYIVLVILGGAFLSRDGVLQPFPPKLKLFLKRVNKFYRVATISAVLALLYYHLIPETVMLNLIISYAFANIFYEAGAKNLVEKKT